MRGAGSRASGRGRTRASTNPFLSHPVAKVLSLLLAGLLLFGINRKLQDTLYEGELQVVKQDAGTGNVLVVQPPAGYVVRLDGDPEELRTKVEVVGIRSLNPRVPAAPTVVASIPEERVAGAGGQWKSVTLEPKDLNIRGLKGVTFVMSPKVSVEVARLGRRRVTADPVVTGKERGYVYEARFESPQTFMVSGPVPVLNRINSKVPIEVAGNQENHTLTRLVLPGGTELTPEHPVRIRVSRSPKAGTRELQLVDVKAVFTISDPERFPYHIDPPREGAVRSVTLLGPPEVVEVYKDNPQAKEELRRRLVVVLRTHEAVENNKKSIEEKGEEGYQITVSGWIPDLADLGFDGHREIRELVTVTLKQSRD